MQNFIKGFFKWVIAGIGIGIGMFTVLVAVEFWNNKNEPEKSDDTTAVSSNEAEKAIEDNSELSSSQSMVNDQDVPIGYKLMEEGGVMLDAPIMGMEWESVKDENTTTNPRVYEPFVIYQCVTEDGEHLRLDVINSDIGYMLKYYFATQGNPLNLEAQQATEDAYYVKYLNATSLIMRDPNNYYKLSQYEDGDTSFYIINTITGQEMNHFSCENNSIENDQYALIAQMEPEHFKFKPMTDELESLLTERFENQ
ncbi:hypothetical protein [Psychrobacter sp. SZ93C1]|uniref:hypothetical protein n=1 Tax=Psychrobacter sp. SZ93C1 TaxID=2792058 RepID=UPI0018CEF962|nr:hypothetical protein [Psychrobacter sp. SZ93C1]MBH0065447.1 hypothetical protein [Psychrobacter sp. SZ93C1]